MTELRPATTEEIAEALSFALRLRGRRPFPQSHNLMADTTAAHLVEHQPLWLSYYERPNRSRAECKPSSPPAASPRRGRCLLEEASSRLSAV